MKLPQLKLLAAAAVGSMFAVGCVVTTGGPVDPVRPSSGVSSPSKTKVSGPAQAAPPPAAAPPPPAPTVAGIAPPVAQTIAPTAAPPPAPPPTPAPPPGPGAIARPPGAIPAPTTLPPAPAGTGTGAKKIAIPTGTSTGIIDTPGKKLAAAASSAALAVCGEDELSVLVAVARDLLGPPRGRGR